MTDTITKAMHSDTAKPTSSTQQGPNFQSLYSLIESLLYNNLDRRLLYHGPDHTFQEVLPAALKLAEWEGLNEEDTLIVKTAALFHDTGFLEEYDRNEPLGCKRAQEILPQYGYSQQQVNRVCECVMATQMPQNPKGNLLAEIVCDADLAYLGTENVFLRSECLRLELNAMKDMDIAPRQWNITSLEFLRNHSYWTKSANSRLKPEKEKHIRRMMDLLNITEESAQE